MLKIARILSACLVGICSFIFIVLNRHFPFLNKAMGLGQSPGLEWVIVCLSFWLAPLFALIWWHLFGWVTGSGTKPWLGARMRRRMFIGDDYDLFLDELRNLKYSLNLALIAAFASIFFAIFSAFIPEKYSVAAERLSALFLLQMWLGFYVCVKTEKKLKRFTKDIEFINDPKTLEIIGIAYQRANLILQRLLKTIFSRQLMMMHE